jgi:hypothetical protein
MPFLNRIGQGSSRRFGFSKILRLGAFFDTFTRANNASVVGGDAPWTATSGTWGISSNTAVTSTAASSYPLLTFDALSTDAVVKATLPAAKSAGAGVAFWVTDNDNWWAAIAEKTDYTAAPFNCPTNGSNIAVVNNSNGNCTYNTTGGGPYPAVGGGPYAYCACSYATVFGCDCYNYYENPPNWWTKVGSADIWGVANAPYNYYVQSAPYNYTATTYGGTPTPWNRSQIKIIKKTAGTVSTVSTTDLSDLTANNYLTYIQAQTTANGATVTTAVSSAPNTVVTAPAISIGTPIPATKFGIVYAPATNNASSAIVRVDYSE